MIEHYGISLIMDIIQDYKVDGSLMKVTVDRLYKEGKISDEMMENIKKYSFMKLYKYSVHGDVTK